ncbi:MAG: type II toxin-antitoxin system PemK/MazF family toxin [Spirochaetaceae bacterium]|jgi:mRNA interferase MazF|nr:type II toxin-antitoxin system PemK/MazF family toxin [Spirochaetaceae bacterium]
MIRGEIWWVDFDPAAGSEIQKTRPAVIMSDTSSNRVLSRVVVIPFTTNVKKFYSGNVLITINGRPSKLLSDQIMDADKSRLKTRIGALSPADLAAVETAIRCYLVL